MKSRHVSVSGSAIRVYCSEACLRAFPVVLEAPAVTTEPSRRFVWVVAGGIAIGASFWWLFQRDNREQVEAAPPPRQIAIQPVVAPAPPPAPTEAELAAAKQAEEDKALVDDLMKDAWIHPLAGPNRRMPINHTAAFGAERDGQRPPECASGHCGVDVGGAIWGEPVHAVHEGVVDWVNRGPNDEHGGVFVKIAHRNGALYSWYFHLAAVPRWIKPGVKVTAGQVIGLLGDTGVKNSGPHLHFSMSVKQGTRERYLDPEPLIAIWPLWIQEGNRGRLSTDEAPGIPVRAPAHAKRQPKATNAPAADVAPAAVPVIDAPAPAPTPVVPTASEPTAALPTN